MKFLMQSTEDLCPELLQPAGQVGGETFKEYEALLYSTFRGLPSLAAQKLNTHMKTFRCAQDNPAGRLPAARSTTAF